MRPNRKLSSTKPRESLHERSTLNKIENKSAENPAQPNRGTQLTGVLHWPNTGYNNNT